MNIHITSPNNELTLGGLALCAVGLCLLVTAVAGIIKLAKG